MNTENGRAVAATAAASVGTYVVFQSLFKKWRSSEPSRPRDALDGISAFLALIEEGPRITLDHFVKMAAPALGGTAYYYSVPYGPGSADDVYIFNMEIDEIEKACTEKQEKRYGVSDLKLVSCSSTTGEDTTVESKPPEAFHNVILAAMGGTQSYDKASHTAAAPAIVEGKVVGVFLIVGMQDMEEGASLDMNSGNKAWAAVLCGRLERVRQLARLQEHERKANLFAIGAKMSKAQTVKQFMDLSRGPMRETMNVERFTIWFIDKTREEIWTPPTKEMPSGMALKFDVGLVGHVARRARQTRDFHKSVLCTNDPQSCPLWKGDTPSIRIDGFHVRNLLSAPILGNQDQKLLGMIQLVNKHSKTHLEDSNGFSESDVRLLEVCANVCADELVRLTVDQIALRAESSNTSPDKRGSSVSFLSEYYEGVGKAAEGDQADASPTMRRKIRSSTSSNEAITGPDIGDWNMDYWKLSEGDEFRLLVQGLTKCSVTEPNRDTMNRFFQAVKGGYNDNPYHNWHHAIATLHYSVKLLETSEMDRFLSENDMFALIFGSLCHDLDHRGYNTAFEVMTRSELALRYNDSSPLENHHCARAFNIAFSSETDCNIFKDLSNESFASVRKTMIAAIIGTDMKFHGEHVKKAQKFDPTASAETQQDIGDRSLFLVELMMHTADIGNPIMPPDISAMWSKCLCDEFTKQVAAERQLSLPVTPFMDGVTTPAGRAKSGIGFTDYVVFPLVGPLFKIFDGWSEPKAWQQENREILAKVIADEQEKDPAAK